MNNRWLQFAYGIIAGLATANKRIENADFDDQNRKRMKEVVQKSAARLVPLSLADKSLMLSLLRSGFPDAPEKIWDQGFERIEESTQILKDQVALALEVDGRFEGIILTLRSQPDWVPDGHELVNLSSWYVSDNARAHATWMLRKVTRQPNSVFLDLTPTEGVARLSRLMKFYPLNDGVARIWLAKNLFAASKDGARLINSQQTLASLENLQFRASIEEHLSSGLLVFGLKINGKIYPLVFRKTLIRGLPVGLTLYFCADFDVFVRNIDVIARGLMRRGWLRLQFDRASELPPTLKYSVWSNRVRLATTGYPPGTIDYLNTETTIFSFD